MENLNIDPIPEREKNQIPEGINSDITDFDDFLKDYALRHPDPIVPESLPEGDPKIKEFLEMIASFEKTFSLEELHNIVELAPILSDKFSYANETDERIAKDVARFTPEFAKQYIAKIAAIKAAVLSPEDARKLEIRKGAIDALKPIVEKLNTLKPNDALEKEYKRLSNAVGFLNNGKIDHNR